MHLGCPPVTLVGRAALVRAEQGDLTIAIGELRPPQHVSVLTKQSQDTLASPQTPWNEH